jgi:hypothetical protein
MYIVIQEEGLYENVMHNKVPLVKEILEFRNCTRAKPGRVASIANNKFTPFFKSRYKYVGPNLYSA